MHRAEKTLTQWVDLQSKSSSCEKLNLDVATRSAADLQLDATDYAYSGLVSLCEAIASIKRQGYSWGTVKGYYASFYLLRSFLASKNVAIFYRSETYWYVTCVDGAEIHRTVQSTHASVISAFKKQSFARNILQEVDGITIVDQLKALREEANYTTSPLSDPLPLPSLQPLSNTFQANKILGSYGRDISAYAYVNGHSLIAFPLLLWMTLKSEMDALKNPVIFTESQRKHLTKFLESFNCKHDFEISLLNLMQGS